MIRVVSVLAFSMLAVGQECTPQTGWTHPKYGDKCSDYEPGGGSEKYACTDTDAKEACCVCQATAVSGDCTPQDGWTHPKYGDTCADYAPGGISEEYACKDSVARAACCSSCGTTGGETEPCTPQEGWTHSKYGDTCADYAPGGKSQKYACTDSEAEAACCSCGGGGAGGGGACSPSSSWTHSKYGDKCDDYLPGGTSFKYRCEDDEAMINCCSCSSALPTVNYCTLNENWKHSKYGDSCADYRAGGASASYECEKEPATNCCTCGYVESVGTCVDKTMPDGSMWHDSGGTKYNCEYYSKAASRCANDGSKYANEGLTANDACCVCNPTSTSTTTSTCSDIKLPSGGDFHDSGGSKYDCAYYGQNVAKRCGAGNDGSKFAFEGLTANQACCVCSGGISGPGGGGPGESGDTQVKVNEGNDITFEYIDGVKYFNKKHLQGGMILYWNADSSNKMLTLALVGPTGWDQDQRWLAFGFSPSGNMAGSDSVVGYFDQNGNAMVLDYHLINQSPAGVKSGVRQSLQDPTLIRWNGRLILQFTREWSPESGATPLNPEKEYVSVIYAIGKQNSKCNPFCNHEMDDRYSSDIAFTAPAGMQSHTLNRGLKGEPCQGIARLECSEEYTCYHPDAFTGDVFAADWENYGECVDSETLGDETSYEETWSGEQTIFPDGGGYEFEEKLKGGFVILWNVNKVSAAGSFSPDDTISVAFISTAPSRQGWIGFGFSPNGLMVGSDVVVGWEDTNKNKLIYDYFLQDQVANENTPTDKQQLFNTRLLKKNGQTAIMFERPLTPADSVQILEGSVHIIYASGPVPTENTGETQFITYHRYRQYQDLVFIPMEGDQAEANRIPAMGICAGPANLECQGDLGCWLFPPAFFDMDWDGMMEEAEENTDGFTENSDWGHGGRDENPFSDIESLRGKGVCLTEGMRAAAASFDFSKFGEAQAIDTSEFDHNLKLRWGFDLYWRHMPNDKIKIALVGMIGPGWMGLGFGTNGQMLGASSVIGWKDFGNETNSQVDQFYLNNKLPWEIKSIAQSPEHADHGMSVSNMEVANLGAENVITFERLLKPTTAFGPEITPGTPQEIIFAVGTTPHPVDKYFGYHRFRDVATVDFAL